MPYLIGIVLALVLLAFFCAMRFDRDRAFYPIILIVVAHYYILFAVMGRSGKALLSECIAASLFLTVAVIGFKKSMWLVAGGLIGHGVFDYFHAGLIVDPGVPEWWPGFCLAFDGAAAIFVAARLGSRPKA